MLFDKQIAAINTYLLNLQNDLCEVIASEDGSAYFEEDIWTRLEGGGGITRILKDGPIIEQAGVNFSAVKGNHLPSSATLLRAELKGAAFQALGISLVIHPRNPYIPTAHMNLRFFIATPPEKTPVWWFGGGFDLTPYYPFKEDCIHWHQMAKKGCDPFGLEIYPKFKKQCDEYFYLKHREETRGVGGLFFDDINATHYWPFETCFEFIKSIGDHFIQAYRPILQKRKNMPYTEKERAFQCYRRGRYVEFNLLYDRGTLFGLQTGGRTESILMSLPPKVEWQYNWQPEAGSKEATLTRDYLKVQEWLT